MSDEKFFAWLDGELDLNEAEEVEALVASDPELARKAAAHRGLQECLSAAFDPIADSPVPLQLRDAAHPGGAEILDLQARRSAPRPITWPVQWMAMAATLAIGVVAAR